MNMRKIKAGQPLSSDGKKILIIDDEAYNCEVLKSMVMLINPDLVGHLIICMSGEEALEKVKDSCLKDEAGNLLSIQIGLIFTDLSMPLMDGY